MIYLLRHGEVEGGAERRFIGQSDPPLSRAGRHHVRVWNKKLASIEWEAVFCSDLRRSEETALIIAGANQAAVHTLPNFREIHLGQWEGLSMAHVRRHFPEQWRKRGDDLANYQPPGGESFKELQERVVPAFEAVSAQVKGHGLIVAHAGVNRVILCHLLGMPLSNLFRLSQDYGALNIIDFDMNTSRVLAINLQSGDFQFR